MRNRARDLRPGSSRGRPAIGRARLVGAVMLLVGLAAAYLAARPGAAEELAGETITLPEGQVVNEDVYAAARNVDLTARVNGDVAAAGEAVTLAGPVRGYVLAAGRDVTVNGRIGNDLWAAGANVAVLIVRSWAFRTGCQGIVRERRAPCQPVVSCIRSIAVID